MSYVNKPGKTSSWRQMVIRQQVSDMIAYGKIKTTFTKAKETQKHVDKIITLGKKNTLDSKRRVLAIIKPTKNLDKQTLLKKLEEIAKKYSQRNGGYTRVLRLGRRPGDRTEVAILELV
ncbi:MAG: 50S ribosomal protein L17 [Mycoplasmataceae bacterium]|nr:50S ribosomal protein L17 [Mycoplasmataceae bacterium]